MTEHSSPETADRLDLTRKIIGAYLSNNSVPAADLPILIRAVSDALTNLTAEGASEAAREEKVEKLKPSQVRKSVLPGGLISFLDGKSYKTLKRHLTKHGLDPDTYRARFGLPPDYPMVAPSYAANRSALAIANGFGTKERHARPRQERTPASRPAGRKTGSEPAARLSAR